MATERASQLREAPSDGRLPPQFEHSAELTAALLARQECANKLEAARQAAAMLGAEHAEAQTAEQRAKGAVREAVRAVVVGELDALAQELAEREGGVLRLRVKLQRANTLWMPGLTTAGPVPMTRRTVEIFNAPPAQTLIESTNSPAQRATAEAAAACRTLAGALCEDPDARFGEGARGGVMAAE